MTEEYILPISTFLVDYKETILQKYNSSVYEAFLLYKDINQGKQLVEWSVFLKTLELIASISKAITLDIDQFSLKSIIFNSKNSEKALKLNMVNTKSLEILISKHKNNRFSTLENNENNNYKNASLSENKIINIDFAMSLLKIPKITEKTIPKNRKYHTIFYEDLEKIDIKNDSILQRCISERHALDLLKYKSASNQLTVEKVYWTTPKKPFLTVCNNPDHAFHMSQISLFEKTKVDKHFKDPLNSMNNITMLIDKKIYSKLNNDIKLCMSSKIHFIPISKNNRNKKPMKINTLNHISYPGNNSVHKFVGQAQHQSQTKVYDFSMGDCSYLDTCYKWDSCRYTHYFTLLPLERLDNDIIDCISFNKETSENIKNNVYNWKEPSSEYLKEELPPQWINCDVSLIDYDILGKFSAIIADPAWNIHMDKTKIPANSNANDEMLLTLDIQKLQDEGIIFLWVTGRAIEQGKKCLKMWGYDYMNEIVWIKTNQLNRTITTGMTGHWLNHSKEHLLVGIKGAPKWINKSVDVDLIVATAREASRKPDQLYGMIERLVGRSTRKLEIFGRQHNTRPGWFTIGNQLEGVNIYEKEVEIKFSKFQNAKIVN